MKIGLHFTFSASFALCNIFGPDPASIKVSWSSTIDLSGSKLGSLYLNYGFPSLESK